jgi:hypothetical protein
MTALQKIGTFYGRFLSMALIWYKDRTVWGKNPFEKN